VGSSKPPAAAGFVFHSIVNRVLTIWFEDLRDTLLMASASLNFLGQRIDNPRLGMSSRRHNAARSTAAETYDRDADV